MAKVLVTGSAGFIGGYLVQELLGRGHEVVGIDNFSKYGPVTHSYDDHPRFRFVEGDARDVDLLTTLLDGCDHLVAGAAMIGGISYFHAYAYDLLATNERIMAATCDAAIRAHRDGRLAKVTYLSSSMVFESTVHWPSREGDERRIPPPLSSYGFQKLAVEYYARAAWEQYRLPYTIVRPFNCVGVGEGRALGQVEVLSGNVKLAMSHVVPDLVQKIVKGQDPLHILGEGGQVRHYTYGGDLARGIATAIEHPAAHNDDFNLSTAESTSVLELAELIWRKIKGPDVPFRHVSDEPFRYDVQKRVPDVTKSREVLGFTATTSLDEMLDEVIPWVTRAVEEGRL
ncbi:NAD-dependent epimerase/dehydratase family protein [Micromonospora sp. 4G57]|uniref:NAD-dependent epimerase/dehydratase family protein n=1 Tax=Micromonospora sicca TaxID=2202420 RepID=A0ABU5JCY7_9ACTN|nr:MULTISPECIES: NAD-dependent epimerase/dehydratase family protein [unclassified Micromonospora]MDZ5444569.1 NAD-dependent epimerase/dehydratase family protein [Micromonospora sp. 4G57]MDZ5490453.1 NAD-dependent epimerase/dehydratase family protein [Micromonospora sp. 4G53]